MSPAVNLALGEVPFAILEVVKARILANRRRLGVGQDQQKPPPSLKPRPQLRKFGASSKNYRRPEPAATGGGAFDGIYSLAWMSWGINSSNSPSNLRYHIASGDGTKNVDLTFGSDAETIILPIDSTSMILVLGNYSVVRCIHVSTSNAKLVSVPSKISNLNFFKLSNSFLGTSDFFRWLEYAVAREDFSVLKFCDIGGGASSSMPPKYFNAYIYRGSPGIFYYIKNEDAAAVASQELTYITEPNGSRYPLYEELYPNITFSGFPKKSVTVCNFDPYLDFLLQYNGPNPRVGNYDPIYDPEIDQDEQIPTLDSVWKKSRRRSNVQEYKGHYYIEEGIANYDDWSVDMDALLWYDWGQPAYCREQLLGLGFTEADLTP